MKLTTGQVLTLGDAQATIARILADNEANQLHRFWSAGRLCEIAGWLTEIAHDLTKAPDEREGYYFDMDAHRAFCLRAYNTSTNRRYLVHYEGDETESYALPGEMVDTRVRDGDYVKLPGRRS